MRTLIATLSLCVFATAVPAVADSIKTDPIPKAMQGFNGMLVGSLQEKDIERGTFVVRVDAVSRVWRNSKADGPGSVVGKQIQIDGVFGKWLDVLVVTRKGETIEFECKHDGEKLVFPGELLRKVAKFDPENYPKLTESFRGFQGTVIADVQRRDPETFELIIKVIDVQEVAKDSSAKDPKSMIGKPLMLAGFWNKKDAYHKVKIGDRLLVGMNHIGRQSEHLTVTNTIRKIERGDSEQMMKMKEAKGQEVKDGLTKSLRGFRGMLVGKLVEKDVERGTFSITVDAVPRVWKNNESSRPKDFIGKRADAGGVDGKLLDTLVVTRTGETLKFGAFHDGGDRLRVVELLQKVAPVKPGDYPELPDAFRGFRGMLVGKVVKKGDELLDLVVEITEVEKQFDNSRAENAKSIIGKQAMLTGFWRRKEAFHSLKVGDTISFGAEQPQKLSDHLSVIEAFRKIEAR